MAKEVRLRHRRRIKKKEVGAVLDALRDDYGMEGIDPEVPLDAGEADPDRMPVYIVGDDVIGLELEGKICPALRGILKWPATKNWVTVDMGAIRFVTNGADIMAPGITDADPDITPGTPVWVRDERHGKPLAVGIAQESGPDLKAGQKGKVIRTIHYIGDPLWHYGHEE